MIVWVQVPSPAYAEVAELADAHGSGPCGSNTVRVQVSSSARWRVLRNQDSFLFVNKCVYEIKKIKTS